MIRPSLSAESNFTCPTPQRGPHNDRESLKNLTIALQPAPLNFKTKLIGETWESYLLQVSAGNIR
jgi:hypothetical protein